MDDVSGHLFSANTAGFDEEQWLKILFLISDSQVWLKSIEKGLLYQLPISGKKKFLRRGLLLTANALAHILERHYYKIQRHPGSGKFTIPVADILACIRDASDKPAQEVKGSVYLQRVADMKMAIGFEPSGNSTSLITVISDVSGRIITAFPGALKSYNL